MKNILIGFCLLLFANDALCQSYHFSQFFSTPLLTNPANTGFTEGPVRVASNMRSQGSTFFTGYLSGDFSLFRNKLEGHKAGVGIYVMNDRSLNNAIQTNSVGLSAAYNVGLDIYGTESFGLGVQGTYHQRRIDYSKLTFENQFSSGGYDPALPAGEPLDYTSKHFFDVNAGVVYNLMLDDRAFFAGLSAYNILSHQENILDEEFKMPLRFNLQVGGQLYVDYGKLYMSVTAMRQAKATEVTVGTAYGVWLGEKNTNELIGGLWYRYKDALIPYIGLHYENLQLGFSYDYTTSDLKTSSQVKNGYELTLLYKATDKRELKTHIPWF
jgi:type IX secretion system PorP/SprF family membrane protein